MSNKIKVIIIAANAYSGSTLFSLFLGKFNPILNLGEVINLESNYNENRKCSCGKALINCHYWTKFKKNSGGNSKFVLSNDSKRTIIDKKGFSFKKLLISIGFSPDFIYGKNIIQKYIDKNEYVFRLFKHNNEEIEFLLDASKPPERLDILLKSTNLDVHCIHLRRNLKSVLISNIKRTRKGRNFFGFKFFIETLLLLLRETHRKRILKKIKSEKKITIDFEDFIENPNFETNKVFKKLQLGKIEKFDNKINLSKQHIYVGNRWIFKSDKIVEINKEKSINQYKLSFTKNLIFNFLRKII